MKKAKFILGSTNSQAVGTTDEEIEHSYQRCYKPFLRALYNAPHVPVALHYSGQLLQWLERHHAEFTDVLSEMVGRKQIELIGGGFYDPVLALIPRPDRLGQIESLTTYLRKRFGRRPRGAWITGQVWEPSLTGTLKSSGMDYLFLDDAHFITAGLSGDDLARPCVTEDQGKTMVVFPVCHDLVRLARTSPPEAVIDYLRSRATQDPTQVFVLLDHGELPAQPVDDDTTVPPRYAWLERLAELLQAEREWIDVQLPAGFLRDVRPRARGYFASASADEMLSWPVLPEREDALRALRERMADGYDSRVPLGYFRQFQARCPESNLIYAKMQYAHVLVNQIRGDKYRKQAAREELWRGQCHSAYWEGSPGIGNNRLRKHAYRALIEAEKKTRERGIFIPSVVTVDFDMDGLDEFLYQGHELNAYVHQEGGVLFELDLLSVSWNYLDTLSLPPGRTNGSPKSALRRAAAPAQTGYLSRKAFVDRFLPEQTTLEQFAAGNARDEGSLTSTLYEREDTRRDSHVIALTATGAVGGGRTLGVRKQYSFKRTTLQVDYRITNTGEQPIRSIFSPEVSLSFLSQEADGLRLFTRTSRSQLREISPEASALPAVAELRLEDLANDVAVVLTPESECEFWIAPLTTPTCGDLPAQYQGTSLLPRIPVDLEPGGVLDVSFGLKFEKL